MVRHQVVRDINGVIYVDADPHSELLLQMEVHNKLSCDLLSSRGFGGNQLRAKAPSINPAAMSAVAVTTQNIRERQDLVMKASTAGKHFVATGGDHINSDEFFISHARADQTDTICKREKEKTARLLSLSWSQKRATL